MSQNSRIYLNEIVLRKLSEMKPGYTVSVHRTPMHPSEYKIVCIRDRKSGYRDDIVIVYHPDLYIINSSEIVYELLDFVSSELEKLNGD